jgi:predicted transcriptional regulator
MAENVPPRQRLLQLIEQYPGLHTRELARRVRMSEALAAYHLNALVSEQVVEVTEDGMFRRHYLRGQRVTQDDRVWMALLRRPVALHITLYILQNGSATHMAITEELGLAKSTMSYHLSALVQAGFLRREQDQFVLEDRERVERILNRWAPTPDLADRFADVFGRFYRRGRKKF